MRLKILGAAAGGGLPQWNCGCANCMAAREGRIPGAHPVFDLRQRRRRAVGGGQRLARHPRAVRRDPRAAPDRLRESPLASVLVTNGDIDHVAGLLTLREKTPFDLFATGAIHDALAGNPMLAALDPELVARREVALDAPFELAPGLTAELYAVPGKVPLYLEEGEDVVTDAEGETTVGVALTANGRTAHYVPGCARMSAALAERLRGASLVLFDGTVWRDDEMRRSGTGAKTGRRMGHMAMADTIPAFAPLGVKTRVFVHMNNTNPALDPASPERAEAEAAGWIVAEDGMEFAP